MSFLLFDWPSDVVTFQKKDEPLDKILPEDLDSIIDRFSE